MLQTYMTSVRHAQSFAWINVVVGNGTTLVVQPVLAHSTIESVQWAVWKLCKVEAVQADVGIVDRFPDAISLHTDWALPFRQD